LHRTNSLIHLHFGARRVTTPRIATHVAHRLRYGRFEMLTRSRKRNPIHRMARLSGAFAAVAALTMPLVAGCEDDDPVVAADFPPFPPDGVFSVTGDELVTIYWNANQESDLAGYRVWRGNEDLTGPYDVIATVSADQTFYDDFDVNNGETWFYAVTAFDNNDHESELSLEDVFDTPRPAGNDLVLVELGQVQGTQAGYDFSSLSNQPQDADLGTTDIYFENQAGVNYVVCADPGVDIQDYGLIGLDGADYAPDPSEGGWAPSKKAEAIVGHSYFVRILNGGHYNYAKFYVDSASSSTLTLDWAYQPSTSDFGNRELTVVGR
jgi:hypothetical protein